MLVLIVALLGLGAGICLWGLAGYLRQADRLTRRAIDLTRAEARAESAEHEWEERPRRVDFSKVDQALAERGFARDLGLLLSHANVRLTIAEFVALSVGCAAFGGLIGAVAMHHVLFGLPFAGVFYMLPRWWLVLRRNARRQAFNNQLGTTLTVLANSLRAGYSITQALDTIAQESQSPTREEFSRLVFETSIGVPLQEAFANMVARLDNLDVDMLATAIAIQREVGGNLAEVVDVISYTIRERAEVKDKVAAITAQQTLSGGVVSALPICLGIALNAINPSYMQGLTTSTCGLSILGVTVVLIIGGIFAMRQVGKVEV